MKKIITFLGKYPKETWYEHHDKVYRGEVFPEALHQFIDYDKMLVFVTKEAKENSWRVLEKLGDERIYPIPIEKGETIEEMWGWFNKILENVENEDTVVFDITHGLRSIPFLVFIFAAFLKSARNVEIEAIYYGAYELGDAKKGKEKPAPVIDLSEFVNMLDWLAATEQFVQTGNARSLSAMLTEGTSGGSAISHAANTLNTISSAARLCHPFTLMQEVDKLAPALINVQKELEISAPPFEVLREEITSAFEQFQYTGEDVSEMLRTEFRLVEWYYEKGQIIQAVTLAREWLIDAVTHRLGENLDFLYQNRRPFEEAISGISLIGKPHPKDRDRIFTENDLNRFGLRLLSWDEKEELKKLWINLKNVRNPVDHAEHQRKKDKQKTLKQLIKLQKRVDDKIMPEIRSLAALWELKP